MSQRVRVRFAPSPTGPLHIGGVRTALFNYLFAKKSGGDFLLRIEDTDQARFVPGAEQYINEALEWLGMVPDEGVKQGGPYGPYKQSERKGTYLPLAQKLIDTGWAYYAFDTPEDLENMRLKAEAEKQTFSYDNKVRNSLLNSLALGEKLTAQKIENGEPYIIRFKMPESVELTATDLIRGGIKFNTSTLDDKVIFKSDGLPTYHLANVADDYAMKITHVIRGEEWLPSLPLHIMLYKALGWEESMPAFAHLPLILKPSGKGKLSKRDGDKEGFPVFPLEWKSSEGEIARGYRESGYFPDAVINLLALLGWNPGSEQEIFSMQELTNSFSLERVNKSGARFDPEKAKWFNQQYLKTKADVELAADFQIILQSRSIAATDEYVAKVVSYIKDRAVFVGDFWELSSYFFEAPVAYEEKTVQKFWKEETPTLIKDCLEILRNNNAFSSVQAEAAIKNYIETNELSFGKIMNPLRLAIVGASKGPHLFDIMEMIGKDESLKRIERAIHTL